METRSRHVEYTKKTQKTGVRKKEKTFATNIEYLSKRGLCIRRIFHSFSSWLTYRQLAQMARHCPFGIDEWQIIIVKLHTADIGRLWMSGNNRLQRILSQCRDLEFSVGNADPTTYHPSDAEFTRLEQEAAQYNWISKNFKARVSKLVIGNVNPQNEADVVLVGEPLVHWFEGWRSLTSLTLCATSAIYFLQYDVHLPTTVTRLSIHHDGYDYYAPTYGFGKLIGDGITDLKIRTARYIGESSWAYRVVIKPNGSHLSKLSWACVHVTESDRAMLIYRHSIDLKLACPVLEHLSIKTPTCMKRKMISLPESVTSLTMQCTGFVKQDADVALITTPLPNLTHLKVLARVCRQNTNIMSILKSTQHLTFLDLNVSYIDVPVATAIVGYCPKLSHLTSQTFNLLHLHDTELHVAHKLERVTPRIRIRRLYAFVESTWSPEYVWSICMQYPTILKEWRFVAKWKSGDSAYYKQVLAQSTMKQLSIDFVERSDSESTSHRMMNEVDDLRVAAEDIHVRLLTEDADKTLLVQDAIKTLSKVCTNLKCLSFGQDDLHISSLRSLDALPSTLERLSFEGVQCDETRDNFISTCMSILPSSLRVLCISAEMVHAQTIINTLAAVVDCERVWQIQHVSIGINQMMYNVNDDHCIDEQVGRLDEVVHTKNATCRHAKFALKIDKASPRTAWHWMFGNY